MLKESSSTAKEQKPYIGFWHAYIPPKITEAPPGTSPLDAFCELSTPPTTSTAPNTERAIGIQPLAQYPQHLDPTTSSRQLSCAETSTKNITCPAGQEESSIEKMVPELQQPSPTMVGRSEWIPYIPPPIPPRTQSAPPRIDDGLMEYEASVSSLDTFSSM